MSMYIHAFAAMGVLLKLQPLLTKTTTVKSAANRLCFESFPQALFPLWDIDSNVNGLDTSCCTNPNMPNLVHQDTERDNQ